MMKRPGAQDRLTRSFYDRDTPIVARELIGHALLRRIGRDWLGGVIVETEAYLGQNDPASHSSRGRTPSNASMFAMPGTLYVYPIHAKHCLNAVTEPEEIGAAVLIRAIEPVWGIKQMQQRRGFQDPRRLTRGPAMLCQALGVNREQDGIDITKHPDLMIAAILPSVKRKIVATPRIGISSTKQAKLRFALAGNRFVSRNTL